MNNTTMNSTVNRVVEKKKFMHDKTKILFCDTFFYDSKLHYIMQCQSMIIYVGYTNGEFKVIWKQTVKQIITSACIVKSSDIIYAGTSKGQIYKFFLRDPDCQIDTIQSCNGKSAIAMNGHHHLQMKETDLFVFYSDKTVRFFVDDKLKKTLVFNYNFRKILCAKEFQNEQDIFCVIFLDNQLSYPYIFDERGLKQLVLSEEPDEVIEHYGNATNYNSDQLLKEEICEVALSNERPFLAVSTNSGNVIIYQIKKNEEVLCRYPLFSIKQNQLVFSLDIVGSGLVYLSKEGITTFNIPKRKKIAKKLLFQGQTSYTAVRWAKQQQNLIYLSTQGAKSKMLYQELNLL